MFEALTFGIVLFLLIMTLKWQDKTTKKLELLDSLLDVTVDMLHEGKQ